MRHLLFTSLLLILALVWPGGAPGQNQEKPKKKPTLVSPFKHLDGKTVVFVASGAGGSTLISDNLFETGLTAKGPVVLLAVPWCQYEVPLQDYADQEAHLDAGGKLAGMIGALQKECPQSRIVLVGHSAGAHVVLAAAGASPKQSINRVIVLAPAVSCTYDLGAALKASKSGIDVFFSRDDTVLDWAEENLGTADGHRHVPTAGRVGFRIRSQEDGRRVRQVCWREGMGGFGDHYTFCRVMPLRKYVLPLVVSDHVAP